ncbi:OpgC family protein [Bradyrhizobium japonicum]|uniref:OpgC family protein n=1 Tax=Bradyrhizobium japonicum TaxID=375 RepID=UPI002714718B|nr:OpgC domain-containing protein [Bradyrhizobium japonicum]WLB52260.1 OpgC domain-containing protein [Bradyrhizobium japonicum]WLB65889.1 OpgC domain-containing protein [Bradyrhizobium japonicum]
MDDRAHTSTRLFGETPPGFRAADRDLRIDVCRGIALWWIFLDHVPNNIGSWLTPRNYGFCDAAEIFMFISGVTCALAYGRAREREGWSGMIGRSLRRGWDIYAAFLLLTLACAILAYLAGSDDLADESNTRVLLEHPGATLAHAAILQYRPVNTDVLPVFVIFHVLFAPLLWLLLRAPNATLGVSLLLYALVHLFGWRVPAWPNGVWFFNPLAWQLLIVLGAWCVIEGEKFRPWVMSRPALVFAVLYLIFGLVLAQSWSIEALVPQTLADLLAPPDKSNLSPMRLLHFVALAIVALRFIPRNWEGLSTPVLSCAKCCGQNSLPIYCFGVLLALASQLTMLDLSEGLAMQIVVSVAGVLMMIVVARVLNAISIQRKSAGTQSIGKVPPVR